MWLLAPISGLTDPWETCLFFHHLTGRLWMKIIGLIFFLVNSQVVHQWQANLFPCTHTVIDHVVVPRPSISIFTPFALWLCSFFLPKGQSMLPNPLTLYLTMWLVLARRMRCLVCFHCCFWDFTISMKNRLRQALWSEKGDEGAEPPRWTPN